MKDLLKYIFGLILIVGVIGIIVSRFFGGNALPTQNNVAEIVKIDKSEPEITVDHKGNTHAQKEVIYITDDQAVLYLKNERDSLKKALGIKDNTIGGLSAQIVGLTTAVSKYKVEVHYLYDSLNKRYIIDQKSRWFSAKGIIPGKDPIIIEGRDSITVAFINKGRKTFANVSSANPDIKYYGVRSFMVPPKRVSGLGIGASGEMEMNNSFKYNDTRISGGLKFMSVGNSIMYDVEAGYRYNYTFGVYPYVGVGVYKRLF